MVDRGQHLRPPVLQRVGFRLAAFRRAGYCRLVAFRRAGYYRLEDLHAGCFRLAAFRQLDCYRAAFEVDRQAFSLDLWVEEVNYDFEADDTRVSRVNPFF